MKRFSVAQKGQLPAIQVRPTGWMQMIERGKFL
jgi:hypothetical protein